MPEGNDNIPNLDHVIDNPTEYGFDWGYGPLEKPRGVRVAERAPFRHVTDIRRAMEIWGEDSVKQGLNQTSWKVEDQKIRDDIKDEPRLSKNDRAMKRLVLERSFGIRRTRKITVVEKPVFFDNDGNEHPTREAAIAANRASQTA